MKIPVCIISYNRAHYLNSLLHSLESELNDIEVVVVDNNSTEKQMQAVFDSWGSKVTFIKLPGNDWINDEYKAKNAFLDYCKNKGYGFESYLFLQDDLQYVGPKNYLKSIIDDLSSSDFLNISVTGVRKSTISSLYSNEKVGDIWKLKDNHFGTIGIHKRNVFETLGKYKQDFPASKEYWGAGEDDYHSRVASHYKNHANIAGFSHVPVFVGVWNDPRGGYSFIRDNRRYGHYLPPVDKTYYERMSYTEYRSLLTLAQPLSFVDVSRPIGWNYAKTLDGDQCKYPQQKIILEGPVQDINE